MRLLFVLLCLVSFKTYAQKKDYKVCAVAFYNFENLFDPADDPNKKDEEFTPNGDNHYTEAIYRQKLHNLATVIEKMGVELNPYGPAIIGTAEIESGKVLEDLASQPEIAARGYKYVWYEGPDERGIDVALMYNPMYFKVLSSKPINVSLDDAGFRTRDILYVCGLLLGDTVHIVVNHWPSRRGGEAATAPKRAAVARINRSIADSLKEDNANARVIIMGDLNDDPIDKSVAEVLGATENMKRKSGLYNPWQKYYKQGIGTLGYNDSWNLFDQIIISNTFFDKTGLRYYKSEVFNREFLKEQFGQFKGYPHRSFSGNQWLNGYSDHFPVLTYFVKE